MALKSKSNGSRNGSIELLRFLFAIVILLHHAELSRFSMDGGYLGCEFFFLITGTFLGKHIKTLPPAADMNEIMHDFLRYIKKRYLAIFIPLLISTIIGYCVYTDIYSLRFWIGSVFSIIGDLLLVQSLGLTCATATGVVWYLSSMFIALWTIGATIL